MDGWRRAGRGRPSRDYSRAGGIEEIDELIGDGRWLPRRLSGDIVFRTRSVEIPGVPISSQRAQRMRFARPTSYIHGAGSEKARRSFARGNPSDLRSPMSTDATAWQSSPSLNLSQRRNAGTLIMALHFVNQLFRNELLFRWSSPGLVTGGAARAQSHHAGRAHRWRMPRSSPARSPWGSTWSFQGSVFDYQDAVGIPKVDFSVKVIEKESLRGGLVFPQPQYGRRRSACSSTSAWCTPRTNWHPKWPGEHPKP